MTTNEPDTSNVIYLDPNSRFEIRQVEDTADPTVAAILAPATGAGTPVAVREKLATLAEGGKFALYGGYLEGDLVAAYVLKREGLANDIALIAVVPEHRKRGIGRILLQDALRRSGKRPLTAETDEEALGFYKTCGFKLVGRRKHPSGTFRYRVGWHTPGLRFKGGSTSAPSMERQEIRPNETTDTGENQSR